MDQGGRFHRLRKNRKERIYSFLLSPSNYSQTTRGADEELEPIMMRIIIVGVIN